MKKNNQGFMLVEALIMSVVVIGVLVFMYVQFQNISTSYDKSFSYNTVNNLYITHELKTFLNDNNYLEEIKEDIASSGTKYVNIADYSITSVVWSELKNRGNVKTILIADESLSSLKGRRTSGLSEKFNDFINYLKVDKEENKYRILVEFNDDTYASIKFGGE